MDCELTLDDDYTNAVWALSPTAVYACSQNLGSVYRSNGAGEWSAGTRIDAARQLGCFCIWGTSPENLYVCTSNGIYHGTR